VIATWVAGSTCLTAQCVRMQQEETQPRELYMGKTAQILRGTLALTLTDTPGSLALNNCKEL